MSKRIVFEVMAVTFDKTERTDGFGGVWDVLLYRVELKPLNDAKANGHIYFPVTQEQAQMYGALVGRQVTIAPEPTAEVPK